MSIAELTIEKTRQGLEAKEFSAVELAESALREAEKQEPNLHAFLTLTPDLARASARATDDKIAKGEKLLPISGVPCSLKDAILVQGIRCTAASRMLENYTAPYDAADPPELPPGTLSGS